MASPSYGAASKGDSDEPTPARTHTTPRRQRFRNRKQNQQGEPKKDNSISTTHSASTAISGHATTAPREKRIPLRVAAIWLAALAIFTQAQASNAKIAPAQNKKAEKGFSISQSSLDKSELSDRNLILKADQLERLGKLNEAQIIWETLLTKAPKSQGWSQEKIDTIHFRLGVNYLLQQNFSTAEKFIEESIRLLEHAHGKQHPTIAYNLKALSAVYSSQGKGSQAEDATLRIIAIHEKTRGPRALETAQSLTRLGDIYSLKQDYSKSIEPYLRSISILKQLPKPDHQSLANALDGLAAAYQLLRRFPEATAVLEDLNKLNNKHSGLRSLDTADSLCKLARSYSLEGINSRAESLFTQALSIFKTEDPNSVKIEHASCLEGLGRFYLNNDKLDKAVRSALEGAQISKRLVGDSENKEWTIPHLIFIGSAYFQLELFKEAKESFEAISLLYKKKNNISNKAGLAHANFMLGLIYGLEGDTNRSLMALEKFAEWTNKFLVRELPLLSMGRREKLMENFNGSPAWMLSFIPIEASSHEVLFKIRLRNQGILQEIERRQFLVARSLTTTQDLIRDLQTTSQQLSNITTTANERAALLMQKAQLEEELYRNLPETDATFVSLDEISKSLPAGSALIEFQKYRPWDGTKPREQRWRPPQYIAMILKKDGFIKAVQLGEAELIDTAILKALNATNQGQSDAEEKWAELSRMLLTPLQQQLAGTQEWFLSPDGEINRVPFAALLSTAQPTLVSGKAIQLHLLTTGRDLLRFKQPSPAGQPPVVMVNPSYGKQIGKLATRLTTTNNKIDPEPASIPQRRSADFGAKEWKPLDYTLSEGQQVSSLLNSQLLSGGQVTARRLQLLIGPRVLHIATHGFFAPDKEHNPEDPLSSLQDNVMQLRGFQGESPSLRSGLVLAGANHPSSNPTDDGYLTAEEATGLNLEGTELVVLSACSTGQGEIRTGEGVYGLQRALTVAGARSTLLSLWKVDDAATAEFMTRFYKRLKAGEGRADALAAVQQEFRDGKTGNTTWREPAYWAAWQLVGDWRPIQGL